MPYNRAILVTIGLTVVFASGYAAGQRQPPPANVGQTAEGRATAHWGENTGNVPAVWIAVDIPTP